MNFNKAHQLILKSEKIFLTTHEGTDGDDLGSLLAMRHALESIGKQTVAAVKGGVPKALLFLPGAHKVGQAISSIDFDLVITFGCNNIPRTGFAELEEWTGPVINFDHHPDNTGFGTVNVVDAEASAVAELMFQFLKDSKINVSQEIAICLLTGIFTDTGGFRHANTQQSTLEVAGELMKKGARIDKIASQTMGKKRPQAIRAWAKGLENLRFDPEKKLLFSVLTQDDMEQIGATDEDLEGFVEFLNHIPQARFVLLLREDKGVVKGSLRSDSNKNMDVSKIAHAFGGGGHKLASGFKVKGRIVRSGGTWKIEA